MYAGPYPDNTESLNVFSPNYLNLNGWCLLQLATPQPPSFGKYIPGLATSWSTTKDQATIHLRTNVTWQQGSPVTSADVRTTLLLQGVESAAIWNDITGFSTPNSSTVVLDVKKGVSPGIALYNALTLYVIPANVYNRFVTPNLEQDLLAVAEHPATATAQSAAISTVLKKLQSFNPSSFVGNGPFQLVRYNNQAVAVEKSPSFYGASKVHVPGVVFQELGSNSAVWAAFEGQQLDIAPVGATNLAVTKMGQVPGGHVAEPDAFEQWNMYFNDHTYPFTSTDVRRAISYILDRKRLAELVVGGTDTTLYPPTPYPTGRKGTAGSCRTASLSPSFWTPRRAKATRWRSPPQLPRC